jgi:ribosomal protein S9
MLLTNCSMLTAEGRREHAYARYVAKRSKGRVKQQQVLLGFRSKIPKTEPSEPIITTEVSGPQSVTGSGSEGGGL